jgi:hypothetical protein
MAGCGQSSRSLGLWYHIVGVGARREIHSGPYTRVLRSEALHSIPGSPTLVLPTLCTRNFFWALCCRACLLSEYVIQAVSDPVRA